MLRFAVEGLRDFLVSWDPQAKAAYIKVAQGRVSQTKKQGPGVYVDLGNHGQLLGVEILDPKHIQVTMLQRIAREFKVPDLRKVNPRVIPGIYANA